MPSSKRGEIEDQNPYESKSKFKSNVKFMISPKKLVPSRLRRRSTTSHSVSEESHQSHQTHRSFVAFHQKPPSIKLYESIGLGSNIKKYLDSRPKMQKKGNRLGEVQYSYVPQNIKFLGMLPNKHWTDKDDQDRANDMQER